MNSVTKAILTIFLLLFAFNRLLQAHEVSRQLLFKRAQKGFSSLEKFNEKLWQRKHEK